MIREPITRRLQRFETYLEDMERKLDSMPTRLELMPVYQRNQKSGFFTGRSRPSLGEQAKLQAWDFFFRPNMRRLHEILGNYTRRARGMVNKCRESAEELNVEIARGFVPDPQRTEKLARNHRWTSRMPGLLGSGLLTLTLFGYYAPDTAATLLMLVFGASLFRWYQKSLKQHKGSEVFLIFLFLCVVGAFFNRWVTIFLLNVSLVVLFLAARKFLSDEKAGIEQAQERTNAEIAACQQLVAHVTAVQARAQRMVEAANGRLELFKRQVPTRISAEQMLERIGRRLSEFAQVARQGCFLDDQDQAVGNQGAPLIIREWAVLKDPQTPGFSRLDGYHLRTFRHGPRGQIIPAIQHLHYIFLTNLSLVVYETFYDFVKGESFGHDVMVFYYKAVTNLGIRRLDKASPLFSSALEVQEFTLANSGGERLSVTLVDDDVVRDKLLPSLWNNRSLPEEDSSVSAFTSLMGQDPEVDVLSGEPMYESTDEESEVDPLGNFGLTQQESGVEQAMRFIQKAIQEHNKAA